MIAKIASIVDESRVLAILAILAIPAIWQFLQAFCRYSSGFLSRLCT